MNGMLQQGENFKLDRLAYRFMNESEGFPPQ